MFAAAASLALALATVQATDDLPATRTEFPANAGIVELPARFVDGDIIVRLSIQGRPLDFVLDSGASSIVIDGNVAAELALAIEPSAAAAVPEGGGATPVDIPAMAVGALTLRDVVASALPFSYEAKDHTRIAGLLGYDFLAGAVIHVDYRRQRAFAILPSEFDPAIPGATSVPVSLDEGVPMVTARVGAKQGNRFIVDSGADDVYIFDGFARSHAADVTDRRGAARQFSSLAYLGSDGAPARMPLTAVDVADFTFAGVDFRHFLAYRAAPSEDDRNVGADGLIGYRFLRYYDVYFDYPGARLVMLPNDLVPDSDQR